MKKFVTISQVAEVNPKIPNEYDKDSKTPVTFLPMAAVSEQGKIIALEESIYCDVVKGYRYFQNGDIIVAKITLCMENGKAAYVESLPHNIGFGSTEFHVIRPSNEIEGRYLFYMVWSPDFRSVAGRNMTGTAGQKRVPTDFIKRYKIPLPPLEEQKRIAAILDKADRVRRKRQEAIRLTEELGRSIFLDMFGDPVTNPKGWKIKKCKDLCSRITVGIVVTPAAYYKDSGVPALRSQNIKTNSISTENLVFFSEEDNETKLSKTKLKSRDVVLVRTGQPGTAAVIPDELDGVNAIDLLITSPNENIIDSLYLCFFFNSSGGKKLVSSSQVGQIQKHLNVGILNSALIPIPPLSLQNQFAQRMELLESIRAKHIKSLSQCDDIFNSLLQRAFRGELSTRS